MTEAQAIFAAFVTLVILFGLSWFYFDYQLDQHNRFLDTDRMLKARFDQWKREHREPPSQQPPTD